MKRNENPDSQNLPDSRLTEFDGLISLYSTPLQCGLVESGIFVNTAASRINSPTECFFACALGYQPLEEVLADGGLA